MKICCLFKYKLIFFSEIMILTISCFVDHEKFCKLVIFKLHCYFFLPPCCLSTNRIGIVNLRIILYRHKMLTVLLLRTLSLKLVELTDILNKNTKKILQILLKSFPHNFCPKKSRQMSVSSQLLNYLSPNPTLTLICYQSNFFRSGEG